MSGLHCENARSKRVHQERFVTPLIHPGHLRWGHGLTVHLGVNWTWLEPFRGAWRCLVAHTGGSGMMREHV